MGFLMIGPSSLTQITVAKYLQMYLCMNLCTYLEKQLIILFKEL